MDSEKFVNSRFFKIGSIHYSESPIPTLEFGNTSTFDATMYNDTKPKQCLIRTNTSVRPHLIRNLNLLSNEGLDSYRDLIQSWWDTSNNYIQSLNVTPYQNFLVITHGESVVPHRHGDHMGDTITVVVVVGEDPVTNRLVLGDDIIQYPPADQNCYAVCFDGNITHATQCSDNNVYFHFVYDLMEKVNFTKNSWTKL